MRRRVEELTEPIPSIMLAAPNRDAAPLIATRLQGEFSMKKTFAMLAL